MVSEAGWKKIERQRTDLFWTLAALPKAKSPGWWAVVVSFEGVGEVVGLDQYQFVDFNGQVLMPLSGCVKLKSKHTTLDATDEQRLDHTWGIRCFRTEAEAQAWYSSEKDRRFQAFRETFAELDIPIFVEGEAAPTVRSPDLSTFGIRRTLRVA